MKLYDIPLSGNCHKVRLLLSFLGLKYETAPLNLAAGGTKKPGFLELNPRGQAPVLVDGELVIWDSMAILAYLARSYGGETWLPGEPSSMAAVMQWLAVSENELLYGLGRARAVNLFNRPWPMAQSQEIGRGGLRVMEIQLGRQHWLAGDRPTIADIACYPYAALAPEGGVSLDDFPRVVDWIGRFESLPGYVGMPGLPIRGALS